MNCRGQTVCIAAGVVLTACAMVACSDTPPGVAVEDAGADVEARSAGTDAAGSVYADLQVEYLVGGKRVYRSMYDEIAPACRELGIGTPLPDDYVEKLGTSRLQVWTTAHGVAVRNEVYVYASNADAGSHCDFAPATMGLHLYMDGTETVSVDLATGVESRAPPRPDHEWKRETSAVGPASREAAPERSVAGFPCLEYADGPGVGATYCIWSGGAAYGFDPHGRSVSNAKGGEANMLTALVLDQTPSDEGNGQRVTLSALVLDDDAPFASMRPHAPTNGPHATRGETAGGVR